MADDWISGPELAEAALSVFSSPAEIKDWLILRLGKGRVSARARSTIIRSQSSDPTLRINDWDLPPSVWTYIALDQDAHRRVDLADNLAQLSGILPVKIEGVQYLPRPVTCNDLKYSAQDLQAILKPQQKISKARASRAGIGGAKPNKEKWENFAAALAVVADQDGIEPHSDASKIYDRVAEFLMRQGYEDNLHIDSVRDAIVRRQNIWHNLRGKLAECGPRLGVDVRRRACGVASADIRWSVV